MGTIHIRYLIYLQAIYGQNIGTFNVHEIFRMLQCNLTKSDESTFFILNVEWVFVRNWLLHNSRGFHVRFYSVKHSNSDNLILHVLKSIAS